MNNYVRETFYSLGYNVELPGSELYFDIIYEVADELKNGLSKEEVIEKIPAYCLELYHFCYEIGKTKFFERVDEFLNSKRKRRKKKRTVNVDEINIEDLSFENQIVYFAKYFIRKEKELESNKKYVKK